MLIALKCETFYIDFSTPLSEIEAFIEHVWDLLEIGWILGLFVELRFYAEAFERGFKIQVFH